MRKISRDAAVALRALNSFSRGNTTVTPTEDGAYVMLLHGNCIAHFSPETLVLRLSDCGWQTVTTKERLNAILSVFGVKNPIYQRDFTWYIGERRWGNGCTLNFLQERAA